MMKFFFHTALILSFFSCKKVLFEDVPSTSPTSLFEQTWNYCNETYSFFEYKNINWDSIKVVYQGRVNDGIATDSLFTVLSDMLYTLEDGHVNLSSSFDRSRNWDWYLDYPVNYDPHLLEREYFKGKQQFMGPFTVFDFEDVGYVHYASFGYSVSDGIMQNVLNKFRYHKGLIIDLRDNGGGSVSNVYTIGNHFVKETKVVGQSRIKNGPGRNDFSEFSNMELSPVEDTWPYDNPVVLLTNRKCYSATNMLVTLMGALPNVTVVGDKTGGGGGVPAYTQLSNGWGLRVSSSQTFTIDGINNEGGVNPDIKVDMLPTDIDNNLDSILEEALKLLRQ